MFKTGDKSKANIADCLCADCYRLRKILGIGDLIAERSPALAEDMIMRETTNYQDAWDAQSALYQEQYADYTLTDRGGHWRLGPADGSRAGSTNLAFHDSEIIIFGDMCPGHNGVVSSYGYSTSWFCGSLSPDYLCRKFLRDVFVSEAAEDAVADEDCASPPEGEHDWLSREMDTEDYDRAFRIDIRDGTLLVAIQQRFAKLRPTISERQGTGQTVGS